MKNTTANLLRDLLWRDNINFMEINIILFKIVQLLNKKSKEFKK